ncbi:hypothetical protein BC739_005841 [Kutzneria viridogrisea]|uniref:HTH luxR-type domain-containing protein n=1 Tax=Kutzneria viridogrisea TaxID=47990 RepID=A0ABR6BNZ8_9PSEU|nr:hypothetical protein [Kutzneria viridogrisea]
MIGSLTAQLHLSLSAVTKYINSVFSKPHLDPSEDDNRRVRAALSHLRAR